MKKLLLLLVFVGVYANAQIVNIPDANFKAKLLSANASNGIASIETPVFGESYGYWFVNSYNVIDTNSDGEIQVSEAQAIKFLRIENNILDLAGINAFSNLQVLKCSSNQIQTLNVSSLYNLKSLECYNNQLSDINISGLINLQDLNCSSNILSILDVSSLSSLKYLNCNTNNISSLNLSGLINLEYLDCLNNQFQNFNGIGLPSLQTLWIGQNQLTNLDVSELTNLRVLYCNENQLTSLDVSSLINLQQLYCNNNQLTNLDVANLTNLQYLFCTNNLINSLLIKNEYVDLEFYNFNGNPNLHYICCSNNQVIQVQQKITNYGYTNCHVNTYCSFTPGGTFYTINGTNRYDENNNGCDAGDVTFPNLKLNITNGTNSGDFIGNTTGDYSIPVQAGTHTLTPQLENPSYFNVSPATAFVTFPDQTSPFTQDFCITPNGVHKDVEITLIPTNAARPGFPANYKLIYKNKGNITVDGTIAVNFSANPDVMHFQSATPNISSQSATELFWDYTALQPFEIREINFTMLLNTPTDTPPLNAGNYLGIDADITPVADDENYIDNHSELKQLVVNSMDPNDKTCLEGQTISNSMIGQYVHYMIRFENTGTYPAQNIVVKDMIDTTKFDVSTLQMTKASHDCYTRINGNKVEFIFENINLPFDDANNDGYVVFKIKTLSTLAQNSSVSNTADIFFDYNFPITTNTATTNFANLSTQNNEKVQVSVYPNPAKNTVNIKSENEINSVSIFDIQGRQVQTKIVGTTETTLDICSLQQGNYLLKINTNKGIATEKIVKE